MGGLGLEEARGVEMRALKAFARVMGFTLVTQIIKALGREIHPLIHGLLPRICLGPQNYVGIRGQMGKPSHMLIHSILNLTP